MWEDRKSEFIHELGCFKELKFIVIPRVLRKVPKLKLASYLKLLLINIGVKESY